MSEISQRETSECEERQIKRDGVGEEERGIWEQREFHAPFIVVAQTCILDLHEHYALL